MKTFAVLLLLATAVGAADAPPPAPRIDSRRIAPVHGDAAAGAAKAAVCSACHGPGGVAIAPNFPNLAAQSPTYVYTQLRMYKEGQRGNAIMTGQAATLSDEDMRNLAAHYAALPRKASTRPDPSSRGASLYLSGDPARGVAPCQGCHGADGHGPRPSPAGVSPQPPWHAFPSLAGQSPLYLTQRLGELRARERNGSTNADVMHGVAVNLSDEDIAALAAYVSSL